MTGQFQVLTHGVNVEVALENSTILKGHVFLHEEAETHIGPERVQDMLESAGDFFPLGLDAVTNSETLLVNKSQALFIRIAKSDEVPPSGPTAEVSALQVSVELDHGGRPLTGVIYLEQPPDRLRTLDFLNSEARFLVLDQPESYCFVRKKAITSLREQSDRFPAPAPATP